jgi:hypothetical protein
MDITNSKGKHRIEDTCNNDPEDHYRISTDYDNNNNNIILKIITIKLSIVVYP